MTRSSVAGFNPIRDSVGEDGYRDILGIAEGCKEDKAGWSGLLAYPKGRGLACPELFISDKCLGLIESLAEYYPEARWQRCMVHFYRNVFALVPKGQVKVVAGMLKATHAQEDRTAARGGGLRPEGQWGRRRISRAGA